jgi:cytochrome P450
MFDTTALQKDDLRHQVERIFASDPEAIADPYPVWNRVREEAPVMQLGNATLFARNSAVRKLVDDPRCSHNAALKGRSAEAARAALTDSQKVAFDEVSAFEAMYMSRNDGGRHDRLRRVAQRTFTPSRIAAIQKNIEDVAYRLIEELPRDSPANMMQFAYRLPLVIIGNMLSAPEQDLDMIHVWSNKLGRNRGGTDAQALMEAHEALKEFRVYIEDLIRGLRAKTRTEDEVSLVNDLLDAKQGEFLSAEEMTAMFVVLLFAGHETTTNLIGSGLLALLQHNQWQHLCNDIKLAPKAVEELLRFVSPIQWIGRHIAESIEIDGHTLEEGDTIQLLLAAANRDPAAFADPDTLDISRQGSRSHLGFGMGSHFCLGSPLARMEAQTAFMILSRRFPDLKLAAPPETLHWTGHGKLRTLVELPIHLGSERKN